MKCHLIAQRIHLQEHLSTNWDEIEKGIDLLLADPSYDTYDAAKVRSEVFTRWFANFKLY